jgi:hypothetical protein
MNNKTLTYRSVMTLAAERKLALAPEQRLAWRRTSGELVDVYSAAGGEHIVDHNYGNLLVMRDGAAIIEGAPTIDAAMTAADCALALGLV